MQVLSTYLGLFSLKTVVYIPISIYWEKIFICSLVKNTAMIFFNPRLLDKQKCLWIKAFLNIHLLIFIFSFFWFLKKRVPLGSQGEQVTKHASWPKNWLTYLHQMTGHKYVRVDYASWHHYMHVILM